MNNKVTFYHRFSMFFLVFFLFGVVCTIGSIIINIKDSSEFKECKLKTVAALSSCVTQEEGGRTYYFGVYTFQYNSTQWNFINSTYYSSESKIPETVSIKHNAFTDKNDMKVKVQFDRNFSIPFIYGTVTFLLFILFIIYRNTYKEQKLVMQARSNVRNIDAEIDQTLSDNELSDNEE